jgi:hypothetical protein
MDLSIMTKNQILDKCKELGINKCSSKIKSELINKIEIKEPIIINNEGYTFIEVCAGCGGLSSGLIKSGFKPLLLNDNNIDCCKT